jgi:hypothetical protein
LLRDVDEEIDELDVHAEGGGDVLGVAVLGAEDRSEKEREGKSNREPPS